MVGNHVKNLPEKLNGLGVGVEPVKLKFQSFHDGKISYDLYASPCTVWVIKCLHSVNKA